MYSYLKPLIDPTSIAVLGASANAARLGGVPISLLLEHGFAGPIYPINPKNTEIQGLPCYPTIASLPEPVDLLVVAVSADNVMPALQEAVRVGIKAAVIFAAGYAEAGDDEGLRLQEELAAFGKATGLLIAGPNCMGFGNLDLHAYSTFTLIFRSVAPPPELRDIGLVTQSGSICAATYAAGRQLGVKFNVVANTGNEACIEFSEYLGYLAERPGTEAIVGYLEGVRDGRRFIEVAGKMRDQRQLLSLLKVGSTEKGAIAAASHTAAITGSHAIYQAIFDRLCVIPANDILHLADIAYLARFRHRQSGPRVAILTISGAIGALLSDQFTRQGVEVPTFDPEIQAMLHTEVPRYGMVLNPVDLTGNIVNRHAFVAEALRIILASDLVDFAVIFAPGYLLDRMADDICQLSSSSHKLIAAIRNGISARQEDFEQHGVPIFDDTTRAVNALSSLAQWHVNHQQHARRSHPTLPQALPQLNSYIQNQRQAQRTSFNEHEAKAFLAHCGLSGGLERIAENEDTAVEVAEQMGYPVVLKILSADIPHKTEVGGVALNLENVSAVRAAWQKISREVRLRAPQAQVDGMLVQNHLPQGIELFVSVARDPTFGLMLNVGLGGLWVEMYNDAICLPLPVDPEELLCKLATLKAWPIINGARGGVSVNTAALVDALVQLTEALRSIEDEIELVEINPLWMKDDVLVPLDALIKLVPLSGANAPSTLATVGA